MKAVASKEMLAPVLLLLLRLTVSSVADGVDKQSSAQSVLDDMSTAAAVAEFRQAAGGGAALGQQLLSGYPSAYNGGFQYMAAASGGNGGYGNMLRQMYRPQASFGLTDKVRNWVKSFLNRRQYVKPYYNPGALLGYGADGNKPVYINGASYKPISVPLRQLQKYFKPFYGSSASSASAETAAQSAALAQYMAAAGLPASAASGFSYGDASGLYASESASGPLFNSGVGGGNSNFFVGGGSSGVGGSSIFGTGSGSSGHSAFGGGSDSSFSPSSNVYSSSGFYGSSGGSGSDFYGGSAGGQNGGSSFYGFGNGGADDLTATSSTHFSSSTANGYYPQSGASGGRNSEMSFAGSNGPPSGPASSGFNFESSAGSYPVESTYSLSYQRPPQSPQGYANGPSNFQPVSFGNGQGNEKSQAGPTNNAGHMSSASSSMYVSEKSS